MLFSIYRKNRIVQYDGFAMCPSYLSNWQTVHRTDKQFRWV